MSLRRFTCLLAFSLIPAGLHAGLAPLPEAVDDSATVRSGRYVDIDVLANDFLPAGAPRTIVILKEPQVGRVTSAGMAPGVYRYEAPPVDEVTTVKFIYRIKAADLQNSATVTVTIDPTEKTVVAASGQPAAGAGSHASLPWGSRFRRFGLPAIDDSGAVAFSATYDFLGRQGRPVTYRGIFASDPLRVIAHARQAAPDTAGTGGSSGEFITFDDPMLNAQGDMAFGAVTVSGTTLRRGLWRVRSGDFLRRVAFEGQTAIGIPKRSGARFGKFLSSVLADSGDLHFVASFTTGANGTPGGRGIWSATEGTLKHVLSEGQTFRVGRKNRVLKKFAALTVVPGSQGHDRIAADGSFAVRLTWEDGGQSLAVVQGGEVDIRLTTGQRAPVAGGKYLSFGLPGLTADGRMYVKARLAPYAPTGSIRRVEIINGIPVPVVISVESRRIAAHNDDMLIAEDSDQDFEILEREGDRLEPEVRASRRFSHLKNPVISPDDEVAILAKGIASADRSLRPALWFDGGDQIEALYRGETVSAFSVMKWERFNSVAYPTTYHGAPLFTARGKQSGVSIDGLWASGLADGSRFVTGSKMQMAIPLQGTKTVRKVHALESALRSPAQRRSYNSNEQLTYRLDFTDGAEAVVLDVIP